MFHRCFFLLLVIPTISFAEIKSLTIDTGRANNEVVTVSGRDTGQQLLVTGLDTNGKTRDLTRSVKYRATPDGVVVITDTGWITTRKEGSVTIEAQSDNGIRASVQVKVTNIEQDVPLNFANDVVPLLTKYTCNSGGCHGKADGQNGFKISLLGFEPELDYESLVKEARGRRINTASPSHSLLLRKATAQMPHGGGKRIESDSPAYRIMRRWIEQGMPYGKPSDPTVTRIEVLPEERLLGVNESQQLLVVAHYSDGSTRDVTRQTQFEANDKNMAEVTETGLVTTKELTGTVAVMARYQATVDVFLATVPMGAPVVDLPKPSNFIDKLVFTRLKTLGLPPSKLSSDSVFLRRVTLDIAGRLPTMEEAKAFLADQNPKKREQLIDRLLQSGDYADHFANKWSAILRNRRESATADTKATFAFHKWIRDGLEKNRPYDQFVQAILTAKGKEVENPPVAWYREVQEPDLQVEDIAQLFLGQRIQCARCHHHPFEKWSQKDYYGFSAFFSQLEYKKPPKPVKQKGKKKKKKGKPAPPPPTEIFHKKGLAKATHPRTGETVLPTGLGGKEYSISVETDPRSKLAEWLTAKDNPFFARTLVNRYWKHFFGRGLVDPEDDMRVTNPPTNPELLNALTQYFIENDYDLKALIRAICNSRTYQLSSESNEYNRTDMQNFSRYQPRRLSAEVLLDAIDTLTLTPTKFRGLPVGTKAIQLPDNAFDSYFLSVFGRPDASSACECERSSDTGLPQLLHLLNSSSIEQKLSGKRALLLARSKKPIKERIREIYLTGLSREPSAKELTLFTKYVEQKGTKNAQSAFADILWAVINGEEFLFNH